jgi:hypothetical protein
MRRFLRIRFCRAAPDDNDIHKIRFTGGPLDSPEEMKAAAELWRAIGLAACAWARLEQHLDAVLIHVNQPKHSEKLHDPDRPIGFKRKIKLLKRWFNQHPVLVLGDPCRPQGFLHPMH